MSETGECRPADLDPLEWQRLADRVADDFRSEISALRDAYLPRPATGSFHSFWPRVRTLNERVRVAPAIKLDDKLELQSTLNELCERARERQRILFEESLHARHEIAAALGLVKEGLDESMSVEDVQSARADLALLRERITAREGTLSSRDRQILWHTWQRTNQAAWTRLNQLWEANEGKLQGSLDCAREALEARQPRVAREHIRAFHAAIPGCECSHQALRRLRTQAAELWSRADEIAKQKHEAYIAGAGNRLARWRSERTKHERDRLALAGRIAEVEGRLTDAATDVAAAMLRAELASLRKELEATEATEKDLARRISGIESAVDESKVT